MYTIGRPLERRLPLSTPWMLRYFVEAYGRSSYLQIARVPAGYGATISPIYRLHPMPPSLQLILDGTTLTCLWRTGFSANRFRPTPSGHCAVRGGGRGGGDGCCELAVLPTRLNLEAEDRGLLSLDFSNASTTANRKVVLEIWSRIFPKALSFVQTVHANPYEEIATGLERTALRHIFVEAAVQQEGTPLGPSLFASAL